MTTTPRPKSLNATLSELVLELKSVKTELSALKEQNLYIQSVTQPYIAPPPAELPPETPVAEIVTPEVTPEVTP